MDFCKGLDHTGLTLVPLGTSTSDTIQGALFKVTSLHCITNGILNAKLTLYTDCTVFRKVKPKLHH